MVNKCPKCSKVIPAPARYEAEAFGCPLRCKDCDFCISPEPDELREWFKRYHEKNPHVYDAFRALAEEIRSQGHKRYGAKTILERLRWESDVRYKGTGLGFKLSNTIKDRCSARYARRLIVDDPSFEGFFEIRKTSTHESRSKMSVAHRGSGGTT